MFGGPVLGYHADSITVAKALSSAYMPIAGVMVPEEMYQAMVDESRKIGVFGHGFTYSGHPVAAAVAVKTLEIYARERLVEKAAAKAPKFQARLKPLGDHPLVGEARGIGLVAGIEIVADKATKRSFDGKQGVAARAVALRRGRRTDRASAAGRLHLDLPAAGDQRGRDRPAVRPALPRARPHSRLGEARAADGGLMLAFCADLSPREERSCEEGSTKTAPRRRR